MRSTIPDDCIVFLQEHEENDGMMEDDPINFRKAMQSSNLENWIEVMNEEYITPWKTIRFVNLSHY